MKCSDLLPIFLLGCPMCFLVCLGKIWHSNDPFPQVEHFGSENDKLTTLISTKLEGTYTFLSV